MASLLLRFVSDMDIGLQCIVGHSLGGIVAVAMAALPESQVEKLVLIGSPPIGLIEALKTDLLRPTGPPTRALFSTAMKLLGKLPSQQPLVKLSMATSIGQRLHGISVTHSYSTLPKQTQSVVDSSFVGGDFSRTLANVHDLSLIHI